jgi:hypothetical protein
MCVCMCVCERERDRDCMYFDKAHHKFAYSSFSKLFSYILALHHIFPSYTSVTTSLDAVLFGKQTQSLHLFLKNLCYYI